MTRLAIVKRARAPCEASGKSGRPASSNAAIAIGVSCAATDAAPTAKSERSRHVVDVLGKDVVHARCGETRLRGRGGGRRVACCAVCKAAARALLLEVLPRAARVARSALLRRLCHVEVRGGGKGRGRGEAGDVVLQRGGAPRLPGRVCSRWRGCRGRRHRALVLVFEPSVVVLKGG